MKTKQTLTVTENERIAEGVCSLVLQYPKEDRPGEVLPGQFVGVYCRDASRLLMRPISICGYDEKEGLLRLVFRIAGKGTEELSDLKKGDAAEVLGILGNGYDLNLLSGKKVLLMGGGIGAPPMLGLAEALQRQNQKQKEKAGEITAVLGYRTDDLFLAEEFSRYARVIIATDDGSAGVHGTVLDAARKEQKEGSLSFDAVCACGPLPMLRGVKAFAEAAGVPCWLSLEERMACGVGACLGCVVKTKKTDSHSGVHNARVCTEGPVFNAEDVEL